MPDSDAAYNRLFISYSREDLEFANQLADGLKFGGFDVTLDLKNIRPAEDWKERLRELILAADTVVFVLTSSSAKSEMCGWEVRTANEYGKRIIPVLPQSIIGTTIPEILAALDYIYFYLEDKKPGSGFGNGLMQLQTALTTDLKWVRMHTHLQNRAMIWFKRNKTHDHLLSEVEVKESIKCIKSNINKKPIPTPLLIEYIQVSKNWLETVKLTEKKRQKDLESLLSEHLETRKENQRLRKQLADQTHEVFQDSEGKYSPEMIPIDTRIGFLMGSPQSAQSGRSNERPCHPIAFSYEFALSIAPITIGQWNSAVKNGFRSEQIDGFLELPITGVTWDGAYAFARWLAWKTKLPYRLPTEAEWEFCCRAGTDTVYPFGSAVNFGDANFDVTFLNNKGAEVKNGITSAKSHNPNSFGLYNMVGNVWEWVEDDYHSNYLNAPDDGSPWIDQPRSNYRILRGGCYTSGPRHLRSARRAKATRTPFETYKIGFRVARNLTSSGS